MALQDVAKSLLAGDNFSKLIGVGILILTATNFFKIGNQGDLTREEFDRQQMITRENIRALYDNQIYSFNYIKILKRDHNEMLRKSDLPESPVEPPDAPKPLPYYPNGEKAPTPSPK
jgi:hypothetical protein